MTNPCITTVTDKILVFSENKSEFRIINSTQRKIEKHHVDNYDYPIEKESLKCDWLAVDIEGKKEIYIELKGNKIPDAVKQLCSSVDILTKDKKSKKLGYVIGTRSPLNSAEIQIESKKVLQSHKLVLRVKTIKHTEAIEKLMADLA